MEPQVGAAASAIAVADFSFWTLFTRADFIVKSVIIILILASIYSWALIFEKYKVFKKIFKSTEEFEQDFINSKSIKTLYEKVDQDSEDPMSIVFRSGAKYLTEKAYEREIPCFGVLGNLILSFSKLLNQKAIHKPSAQHVLDDDYYKRIEAIQFTMSHDDGKKVDDINNADIILLGVSRTSKTPTSIYLANKGFKTSNIPLVNENSLPETLKKNPKMACVVGLSTEPERLADLRKNRMNSLKESENTKYTDLENIKKEVLEAKKTFQKYKWPLIDVTRKSVEETAASIIKIYEIGTVTLADLLLLFIYTEVLGMIGVFYASNRIPITLPLFIAMTAISRLIILQGKGMDASVLLYEAGAKEVHVKIACPEIRYPDFYGVDTPTKKELLAANKSVDEICEFVESLASGAHAA